MEIYEREIIERTGLTPLQVREWRNAHLAQYGLRMEKHRWMWPEAAVGALLGAFGLESGAVTGLGEKTPAPLDERAQETVCEKAAEPVVRVLTVIRSAPHIRNKTVVEAVEGVVQWREAAMARVGVVNVRVRNNGRVRPGFRVEAEQINEGYWKMRRFV